VLKNWQLNAAEGPVPQIKASCRDSYFPYKHSFSGISGIGTCEQSSGKFGKND
jgi:hypothetical protein